jgi:hypothetical protein
LWARDNALDQAAEMIVLTRKRLLHFLDERFVGKNQGSTERIREHLPGEVPYEVGLAAVANVLLQPLQARAFRSIGEIGANVDRTATKISFASFTDRAIRFEDQAE